MNPKDYTEEILNRRFALVTTCGHFDYKPAPENFRRAPKGAWGIPGTFTLREARDGLPLPDMCKHWAKGVIMSKTSCEKLRRLKPGKKAQMNNDKWYHNCWWALRLDSDEEDAIEKLVVAKDAELRKVQGKIKNLVGTLQKEERKLRKELRALRDEQMSCS